MLCSDVGDHKKCDAEVSVEDRRVPQNGFIASEGADESLAHQMPTILLVCFPIARRRINRYDRMPKA